LVRSLHIAADEQRLVYQGTELKKDATLGHYNISEGSTIQLMKLLLAVRKGSNLTKINFVLTWGWRRLKKGYLDGMCFMYNGLDLDNYVDYQRTRAEGISHSGNVVTKLTKTTKHIIQVNLEAVDPHISHLFFVLSAAFAGTISQFDDPGVWLFDQMNPEKQLSNFKIESAAECQTVVMCCLKRAADGWDVIQLGTESRGTVFAVQPILETIKELFRKRLI